MPLFSLVWSGEPLCAQWTHTASFSKTIQLPLIWKKYRYNIISLSSSGFKSLMKTRPPIYKEIQQWRWLLHNKFSNVSQCNCLRLFWKRLLLIFRSNFHDSVAEHISFRNGEEWCTSSSSSIMVSALVSYAADEFDPSSGQLKDCVWIWYSLFPHKARIIKEWEQILGGSEWG